MVHKLIFGIYNLLIKGLCYNPFTRYHGHPSDDVSLFHPEIFLFDEGRTLTCLISIIQVAHLHLFEIFEGDENEKSVKPAPMIIIPRVLPTSAESHVFRGPVRSLLLNAVEISPFRQRRPL